jgi:hypothetical protein
MDKTEPTVAFVSYDEKPDIQAISNTARDLPPVASEHACIARDQNTSALAHRACWRGSTCSPDRFMPASKNATVRANSSASSRSLM